MAVCPYCGTPASREGIQGTLASEFGGKTSRRKATGYVCEGCAKRFTTIRGRGEEVIVSARIHNKMRTDLDKEKASNSALKKKMSLLLTEMRNSDAALRKAKETAYIRSLQVRMHELLAQIEYLKREKGRLEGELSLV